MDLSFGRRGLRGDPVRFTLDHARLIATVAAAQAATRTAQVAAQLARARTLETDPLEALVAVIANRPGWAAAATALGGSFHPRVAETGRQGSSPGSLPWQVSLLSTPIA